MHVTILESEPSIPVAIPGVHYIDDTGLESSLLISNHTGSMAVSTKYFYVLAARLD